MTRLISQLLIVIGAIVGLQGAMLVPSLFNPDLYQQGPTGLSGLTLLYMAAPLIGGIVMIFCGWRLSKSKKVQEQAKLAREKSSSGYSSKPAFGLTFMVIGALVAFSPLAIAMANTAPGHNWMSEGDSQSGGAAIWLMMFTLPVGAIIGIYGLVKLIQSASKSAVKSGEVVAEVEVAETAAAKPAASKGAKTTLAVVLMFFGVSSVAQSLTELMMAQYLPAGVVFQGVASLVIGLALVVFGVRLIRAKK